MTPSTDLASHLIQADEAARAMEAKWGVGRLPRLVSPETYQRFAQTWAMFTDAIRQQRIEDTNATPPVRGLRTMGPAMARAWAALDAEATATGHQPLAPEVWECQMPGGATLRVVRTSAEAHAVATDARQAVSDGQVVVWTLEELGRLVERSQAENAVKLAFPGAEVVRYVKTSETFAHDLATKDPLFESLHGEEAA